MDIKSDKSESFKNKKYNSLSDSSSSDFFSSDEELKKSDSSDFSLEDNNKKDKKTTNESQKKKKKYNFDYDNANMSQLKLFLSKQGYENSTSGLKSWQLRGIVKAYVKYGKYISPKKQKETLPLPQDNSKLLKNIKYYTEALMPEGVDFLEHLKEHGWAVWKNAINTSKNNELLDEFLTWIESSKNEEQKTEFNRYDSESWNLNNLPSSVNGIFKGHGIGHTEFLWKAREYCKYIFEKIYNDESLLVSFDGASFYPPTSKNSIKPRFHSDQGRWKSKFDCIQGILNLKDCGIEDGGFLFIEGSHKIHKQYRKLHPHMLWSWELADTESNPLKHLPWKKVVCSAGDLICFNSKLFHSGIFPTSNSNTYRAALYISFQPKKYVEKKELEMRQRYYKNKTMTGHWCYGPWFSSAKQGFTPYNKYIIKQEIFDFKKSKNRKEIAY